MIYVKNTITAFSATNLTDTYSDWSESTTYTLETNNASLTNASMVRYGAYYWRSLTNNNLNNNPELTENIHWVKYGISNKFAMLDLSSQSSSSYNGDMYVEFPITVTNTALGIGNYISQNVQIDIYDALNNIVWTYTTPDTINSEVIDWWTYIYADYNFQFGRTAYINLPSYLGVKARVTFYQPVGLNASCGFLSYGDGVDMGKTKTPINFKFTSYAKKTYDDFGSLSITKGAVQDLLDFITVIDKDYFMSNKRKIKDVYNDIIMFVLDESSTSQFENLVTLGVIQDASPILDEYDKSIISWTVVEAL